MMSAGTVPSSSSGGSNESQTSTGAMDKYIYEINESERIHVCHYLEQQSVWEEAAKNMGYTKSDCIKIHKLARDKGKSLAEQLLALWGDQNHTVTELYMLLYRMGQFSAMECLKDYVDKKYHRLLLNGLPNFEILLARSRAMNSTNQMKSSSKIQNGPVMSRTTNESVSDSSSIQTSEVLNLNENKLHKIQEMAQATPNISYHELKAATSDWSESNILGRGGFGIVYKGYWKNTEVAIKKLVYRGAAEDSKKQAMIQLKQSLNELRHLNSCRHDNVLPLYGYSLDKTISSAEPCIVYQFMSGGSLENRLSKPLSESKTLSFPLRNRIILGTARGLQYLHTYIKGKPLIHGDIKPANILLDPCGVPKIGDFGLVREGSVESTEVSSVYGTRPYLPIEFLVKKALSTKIDTYSFGVVLFELYTGLRAHDRNRGKEKAELAFLAKHMWFSFNNNKPMFEFLDKNLEKNYPQTVCPTVYTKIIKIGLMCTKDNAESRPEMEKVYKELEECIPKKFLPEN